ncbi:hypothetical protein [Microbulbifer sp. DLAB2-AA]|uniref:hypothetical protein n=1 Tax=Microbulbifer sp. DLAB2-AA TaxID=3243394 RepID=UPI00403941F9
MTAHVQQLHRVNNLCAGLEWVAGCPDQTVRTALLQLIGEEVEETLQGVIFAVEAKAAGTSLPIEEAA